MCHKFIPCCATDNMIGVSVRQWLYYAVLVYGMALVFFVVSRSICFFSDFHMLDPDGTVNRASLLFTLDLLIEFANTFFSFYFIKTEYCDHGVNIIGNNITHENVTLDDCFESYIIFQHVKYMVNIMISLIVLEGYTIKSVVQSYGCNHTAYIALATEILFYVVVLMLWFVFNNKLLRDKE